MNEWMNEYWWCRGKDAQENIWTFKVTKWQEPGENHILRNPTVRTWRRPRQCEVYRTCNNHATNEKCIKIFWSQNLSGSLAVPRSMRIILKFILNTVRVEWISLDWEVDKWQAHVNKVSKAWAPYEVGNVLCR